MSSSKQQQRSVVQALLARAHSPDSASRIFSDKIQHRPLLLRPSSPPPVADAREERRRARERRLRQRARALKPKPLSARERRRRGLYDVPRAGLRYAAFEPLHRLWLGYVREVLAGDLWAGGPAAAAKLSSADFHGAAVEVARSRCPGRVGIRGIVIRDSRFAFELVTPADRTKLVPKEGTVFRVAVPPPAADDGDEQKTTETTTTTTTLLPSGDRDGSQTKTETKEARLPATSDAGRSAMVFEIHGDQFMYRSADRANKKFKPHFLKNL